jgi:hypothetical protein
MADVDYHKRPNRRKQEEESVSACGAPNDLPEYQEDSSGSAPMKI